MSELVLGNKFPATYSDCITIKNESDFVVMLSEKTVCMIDILEVVQLRDWLNDWLDQ
jgi:hypothetical protein